MPLAVQQLKATLQSINTHGTAILLVEQNMVA
jgi:ABC-type branched-subunit amino acid transport system ATPase component